MPVCWVTLVPSEQRTQVLVMLGPDEVLRAELPPLGQAAHENAVSRFLEGLSLLLDQRLCVALCADDTVDSYRLGLVDELGVGARSIYFAVELLPAQGPGRRPKRLRGVGDFAPLRQLWLWASSEGQP